MDKLTKPDGISIHALLAESDFAVAVNIKVMGNFYPRSPCGERRYSGKRFMLEVDISIHALLAESDGAVVDVIAEVGISIHALLAESDVTGTAKCFALNAFLSTLSLRRATWRAAFQRLRDSYFYPRSPCGERPSLLNTQQRHFAFLSTLSLRRATSPSGTCSHRHWHFYPRSPCGERLQTLNAMF